MARERYLLNDEESTIHSNQIVPTTAKEKRENWWFHYKTRVIAIVLVAATAISIIWSVVSKEDPDYIVTVMTEYTMPEELLTDMENHMEKYAEDLNGDGEVLVSIQFCRFFTSGSTEYEATELESSFVRFAADATSGDTMLFIYDDASYEYLDQNSLEGFFGPMDDTENEFYYWKDFDSLSKLELNHYLETGVSVENVQKVLGDLKISIRTQDGAAFDKKEKIEYRAECIELYERMMNDQPTNE